MRGNGKDSSGTLRARVLCILTGLWKKQCSLSLLRKVFLHVFNLTTTDNSVLQHLQSWDLWIRLWLIFIVVQQSLKEEIKTSSFTELLCCCYRLHSNANTSSCQINDTSWSLQLELLEQVFFCVSILKLHIFSTMYLNVFLNSKNVRVPVSESSI